MCIEIIWNNSFFSRRTRPGRGSNRSSATANVTLYCTWRPSGLTIGLHGRGNLVWSAIANNSCSNAAYSQRSPSNGTKSTEDKKAVLSQGTTARCGELVLKVCTQHNPRKTQRMDNNIAQPHPVPCVNSPLAVRNSLALSLLAEDLPLPQIFPHHRPSGWIHGLHDWTVSSEHLGFCFLWSPYRQAIIFLPCGFYLLLLFLA